MSPPLHGFLQLKQKSTRRPSSSSTSRTSSSSSISTLAVSEESNRSLDSSEHFMQASQSRGGDKESLPLNSSASDDNDVNDNTIATSSLHKQRNNSFNSSSRCGGVDGFTLNAAAGVNHLHEYHLPLWQQKKNQQRNNSAKSLYKTTTSSSNKLRAKIPSSSVLCFTSLPLLAWSALKRLILLLIGSKARPRLRILIVLSLLAVVGLLTLHFGKTNRELKRYFNSCKISEMDPDLYRKLIAHRNMSGSSALRIAYINRHHGVKEAGRI